MTVATTERTEKKDRIKELLTLTEINTADTTWIVDTQDLLNIDGLTAYELFKELGHDDKRRLLWIVTAVCGYESFAWYLDYGIWPHFSERYAARFNDREEALLKKDDHISNKLHQYHERHGAELRQLREQVGRLQYSLEDEKKKNSKIKALFRILKRQV